LSKVTWKKKKHSAIPLSHHILYKKDGSSKVKFGGKKSPDITLSPGGCGEGDNFLPDKDPIMNT
jgi:hypothetical protein